MKKLYEDIESMKKYYPNIKDEDFLSLIELDPTYIPGSDVAGTYGKWLLSLANAGRLDNKGHVRDLLTRFESEKKNLRNKDIMSYRSLEAVDQMLDNPDSYVAQSHRQEVRQRQRDRRSVDLDKDAEKVYEDDKWEVWIPKTYAASCRLGQGAAWCTASTESDYYYNMYKNRYGGDYYININKSNPEEKYQFHFESNQFMDKEDYEIDLRDFLDANPGLKEFYFKKIIDEIKEQYLVSGDKVSLHYTTGDLQNLIYGCTGNHRYSSWDVIKGDTTLEILEGTDLYWFEDDEYYSWDNLFSNVPNLPELNDSCKKLLVEKFPEFKNIESNSDIFEILNEDREEYSELINCISAAFGDACVIGALETAQVDINEYIKSILPEYVDINTPINIDIPLEDAVYSIIDGESDIRGEFENNFQNEDWNLTEPQYGWSGFSDSEFLLALENNLEEL